MRTDAAALVVIRIQLVGHGTQNLLTTDARFKASGDGGSLRFQSRRQWYKPLKLPDLFHKDAEV
jgi:hypothetical protein